MLFFKLDEDDRVLILMSKMHSFPFPATMVLSQVQMVLSQVLSQVQMVNCKLIQLLLRTLIWKKEQIEDGTKSKLIFLVHNSGISRKN